MDPFSLTETGYPRPQLWKPLNPENSEVRVFSLEPPENNGQPLRGSLRIWSLARYPRYDAISWAWGTAGPMSSIIIDDMAWRIPSKLEACLRRLGQISRSLTFWVDAVCVDQFNRVERAQQVKLMELIFSNANNVLVWLGSHHSAFRGLPPDFRNTFVEFSQPDKQRSPEAEKFLSSRAVGAAMFEDWWHRCWPMQEVILARNVFLTFDDQTIDIETLRHIVQQTSLGVTQINDLLQLVDFRQEVHSEKSDGCAKLTHLLYQSRLRGTTDPRDRVYGLLGVCTFLFGKDFLLPDYEKATPTVYCELAWRLIEETGSLAVLNQVVPLYHTDPAIPSWVPDLNSRYDHRPEQGRLKNWSSYQASASVSVPPGREQHRNHNNVLACLGKVFDRVSDVFELCERKYEAEANADEELCWYNCTILAWYNQYAARRSPTLRERKLPHKFSDDKFFATVLRSPRPSRFYVNNENNPDWPKFQSLFVSGLSEYKTSATPTTPATQLLSSTVCAMTTHWIRPMFDKLRETELHQSEPERMKNVLESLKTCFVNLSGSRFFLMESGRVGLGPADSKPGDKLAVLAGGNVPYVLRKTEREGYKQESGYVLVGECYVYGAMQGEIVKDGESSRRILIY